MLRAFWNTEDLVEIHERKPADPDQFASSEALAETVRRLEYRLDGDLRQIDVALANRPTDILINLLTTADDVGEADWRDHHLQTFLIRSGPHLVRSRAFLYALRRLVAERLAALRPDETRKRLYRLATTFDPERGADPTTRGTPRIMALASDMARRGALGRLIKGGAAKFVEQYVTYYNGSIRTLQAFAEERARQRIYESLLEEIDEQQRVLTGLFLEVEGSLERLNQTIHDDELRHQPGTMTENTLHVCADALSKRALWEELRDASGGQRLGPEANKALARQVYAKARRNRRARKPEGLQDLRDLFWKTVVEDFAVRRVREDYRAVHVMSVMGAIAKECELTGQDVAARLRELVRIVERQSEPMVTLTSPTDGQAVRFWALSPKLREDMQPYGDVDLLLNPAGQGTQPVEEPEFSETELLCVSLQVNLELAHLAKLSPPVAGNGSVAPDRAGRYFNGYQRMVDELIDAAGAGRVAHTFTPHIHRDWHKPGILPEIAEGVTRHLVRDVNRAIMAALVSGALRFDQSHGQRIAEVSTVGRVPTGSISLVIANSHDVFETVRAFERHPEAVRACLNLWQHEMQRLSRVADARESPLAQALEAGTALDYRAAHRREPPRRGAARRPRRRPRRRPLPSDRRGSGGGAAGPARARPPRDGGAPGDRRQRGRAGARARCADAGDVPQGRGAVRQGARALAGR